MQNENHHRDWSVDGALRTVVKDGSTQCRQVFQPLHLGNKQRHNSHQIFVSFH